MEEGVMEGVMAGRRMGGVMEGRRWGIVVLLLLVDLVRERRMGIIRRIRSIRRRRSIIGVRVGVGAALVALRLIRIRWAGVCCSLDDGMVWVG